MPSQDGSFGWKTDRPAKGRRRRLSAPTLSLHGFCLPEPKKCRSWSRNLLRRWASVTFNFCTFSKEESAASAATVTAEEEEEANLNFAPVTPPPKPPRVSAGRLDLSSSWSTIAADRPSRVDGEGSFSSSTLVERTGSSLLVMFQQCHPSTLQLASSTPDGSSSTLTCSRESSGAANKKKRADPALEEGGKEEEESLWLTTKDGTHPSGADDDSLLVVVDDVVADKGDKSRLFFTKLLRPLLSTRQHRLDDDDFRLEDALVLWRQWRLVSLITSVRQVPPHVIFFFAFYGRHHRQLMNNSGSCPSGMNLCPASARLAKGDASLAHDGDASWEHRVPVGAAATFRSLTRPHSRHLAGWLAHLLRLTGSRARPHRFLRAPVIQLVVE